VRSRLTPIDCGIREYLESPPRCPRRFAQINHSRMVELAHSMPDCQSAVLACLVWQASQQERLGYGPYARQYLARLSGQQLVEMTGRPLRTVRHALSRLKQTGMIRSENKAAGQKAVYALVLRSV
jgi:hypothetical protein